nr:thioredoxin-like domain-containing protein [uncultured Flavobacterium sp.]
MYLTRTKVLLPFLLLCLAACGRKEDGYAAYFSGQVKNPRLPYVLFCRNNKPIDTLKLDKNNHFYAKFDSLTPGIYSFKHEPDYQYVYFEKNDSISVSIDAENFDNSIVFSGRGEQKNNFMMELFQMIDNDRRSSYDIFGKEPAEFTRYIDSCYAKRQALYNSRKKETGWSKDFDFYAYKRLMLNYYGYYEYYPYLYARRTGEDIKDKLPKDFYSYRKNINLKDKKLTSFSPFIRYCLALVNNRAYYKTFKDDALDENSVAFNLNKLNVADSLFSNQELKNTVLDNIAFAYLLEDQNVTNNSRFINRYEELSTNEDPNNEIYRQIKAIKELVPGHKLPEVALVGIDGKPYKIQDNVKRKTVVFFWTGCARVLLQQVYDKVSALQKKHPEIDFIAINVDNDTEWKKNLKAYDHIGVTQVRATNFDELRHSWVLNKINRTIILNADGTVRDAFTNLLGDSFEKELR